MFFWVTPPIWNALETKKFLPLRKRPKEKRMTNRRILNALLLPKDVTIIKIKGQLKYKDPESHGYAFKDHHAK